MTEIRIAAALWLRGDGRTLLVRKRGTSAFMQPGGKLEPQETPAQALCREVSEELGVTVDPGALVALGQRSAIAANEAGHVVVADLFRIFSDAAITPQAEIAETRWVTQDEALSLPLAPLTRDHVLPMMGKVGTGFHN